MDAEARPRTVNDYLVGPRWLGALMLLILASLIAHRPVLVFAGCILLLALGLSRVWGHYCLTSLSYQRSLSASTSEFGAEVLLTTSIANNKLLPLPWLEIADELPESLELLQGTLGFSWKPRRRNLQQLLSIRWYERVTRRYRLRCLERGEYQLGPVELRSGDLFGLAKRSRILDERLSILVYPKVVPVEALGLPSRFPLGDTRMQQRLARDPLRVAAIRPYVPGDSIRQVHWKATARMDSVQVKVTDPSTTLQVMVLLNLSTSSKIWEGVHTEALELAICVAASLGSHLIGQRVPFGLAANAHLSGSSHVARIPIGRAAGHLTTVLSVLARLTPLTAIPFSSLLALERPRVPAGATVVLITAMLDDPIHAQIRALRAAGHPVSLLLIGDSLEGVKVTGVTVHSIGNESRWRDLSTLRVVPAGA